MKISKKTVMNHLKIIISSEREVGGMEILRDELLTFEKVGTRLRERLVIGNDYLISIIKYIYQALCVISIIKMTTTMQEAKQECQGKLVIIGNSAVGKTNLLLRFTHQDYRPSTTSTIGVDFKTKTVEVEGAKVRLQIWDTAGQERFRTIPEAYYKGADAVILAYSVTDRKSFNELGKWVDEVMEINPNIHKLIVGTKIDCFGSERQVSFYEGESLARRYETAFLECSAREDINISDIFTHVAKCIKEQYAGIPLRANSNALQIIEPPKGSKVSCPC